MKSVKYLIALGIMLSASAAQADLLVYEGFDGYYGKSTTKAGDAYNGKESHLVSSKYLNGGKGWAGGWSGSMRIGHDSLKRAGSTYSKGHAYGTFQSPRYRTINTSANSAVAKAGLVDGGYIGKAGKTVWVSAKMSLADHRWGGISFFKDNQEVMYVGKGDRRVGNGYKRFWKTELGGLPGIGGKSTHDGGKDGPAYSKDRSKPDLVVLRIKYSTGGAVTVTMWINPGKDANGNPTGKSYTVKNTGDRRFNRIRIGHGHNSKLGFDEFKLGTTYKSVTSGAVPEPATMALLAFGSVGCLLRRRKKSA